MSHGFGLEGQRRQLPTPPPTQRFPRHLHAPPGHALHHAGRKQPSGAGCEQPEGWPAGPLVAPGERPGPSGMQFTEAGVAGWVPAAASIQRSCCGVRVGCEVGCFGRWFIFFFFLVRLLGLAAISPPPHVTSRDAGETRSHSSRDRRLCHCSTAVRCALSIRRQWLDSGAPVEYCPITILPMKSLLLFTLCPYTGESRNRDLSRPKASLVYPQPRPQKAKRPAIAPSHSTPDTSGFGI